MDCKSKLLLQNGIYGKVKKKQAGGVQWVYVCSRRTKSGSERGMRVSERVKEKHKKRERKGRND